jgi:hypothetical protein
LEIGKRVTILLPIFFYHNRDQSLPRLGLGRVVTPRLAAEKLKFAELSIPLFLVVFGNNFGKMEVTLYIDGFAYKN